MGILIVREPATLEQVSEMLKELDDVIKLAVDLERGVLADGGESHADCEQVLLKDGSRQRDVWGGDWFPDTRDIGFESLINIRPRQDNRSLELEAPELRQRFEAIVRTLLEIV